MLDRFLELSLATPDIRASLHFYTLLGFSEAPVGEAWNHPYAVVTDGRLCLGLHQAEEFSTSLTFVRPDLLKYLENLEQRGQALEFRRLGNDVFNEVGWLDPSGHLVRLIEARTFSPAKRHGLETTACGYFTEIALPTTDLENAKVRWEAFGFVGMDEFDGPLPHVTCTSDTVDVGLYDSTQLRQTTLLFEVDDMVVAKANLDALGVRRQSRLPGALQASSAALMTAPEGTPLLLLQGPGNPVPRPGITDPQPDFRSPGPARRA